MVESIRLGKICPVMPSDKRVRLADATAKYNLSSPYTEGVSEMDLFTRKYEEIQTLYIYATAGSANSMNMKAVMDMFNEYRPLVEAVATYFVKKQVGGALACDLAESNKDVVMRPICEDTFKASATNAIAVGPYTQSVTIGTARDLIPSAASIADGWSTGVAATAVYTATREQQTLVIMGWGEFYSSDPVVSRVQTTLSDRAEDRQPVEVYLMQLGDMKVMKLGSAEWVEDDSTLDINVTAIRNGVTGMYPIGIDICTANRVAVA